MPGTEVKILNEGQTLMAWGCGLPFFKGAPLLDVTCIATNATADQGGIWGSYAKFVVVNLSYGRWGYLSCTTVLKGAPSQGEDAIFDSKK